MESLEETKKYLKYSKYLVNLLIETMRADEVVLKEYKKLLNKFTKRNKRVIVKLALDNTPSKTDLELEQMILTFAKMINYSEFRNDEDLITADSISGSMDIHADKEFMIMPGLNVSFNKVWIFHSVEENTKLLELYNHMYFHALRFTILAGGLHRLDEIQLTYNEHENKISGMCNLTKYLMDKSIDSNEDILIDDKDKTKKAYGVVVDSFSKSMTNNNINSMDDIDIENAYMQPKLITALTEFRTDLKESVSNNGITNESLIDVSISALREAKKTTELSPEMKTQMNLLAHIFKAKFEKDTKLKNQKNMMKIYKEIMTYYDDSEKIDKRELKKLMKMSKQ